MDGQPADRGTIHQQSDSRVDPKLILFEASTGLKTSADPNIHCSRALLLRCALAYPYAKIIIRAPGDDGGSLKCIQKFCFKDVDADGLQPFALAGIIDVIVEAARDDTEHHIHVPKKSPSGHHQDSAVTPCDAFSERLVYCKEPHADCLLGSVRLKRERAGREAHSRAQRLFQLIAEMIRSGSDCESVPKACMDQLRRTQADEPDPECLAATVMQAYLAWVKEPTDVHCGVFQAALNKARRLLFAGWSQGDVDTSGRVFLDAMSKIPQDRLPHSNHGPGRDLRVLIEEAIVIHAALQGAVLPGNVPATDCAEESPSGTAASLPQAEARVMTAANSEPQQQRRQYLLQHSANLLLSGPAHSYLEGLADVEVSSSPFSGAACLLLHIYAAWDFYSHCASLLCSCDFALC